MLFTCKSPLNYCLLFIINKDGHLMHNLTHKKDISPGNDSVKVS